MYDLFLPACRLSREPQLLTLKQRFCLYPHTVTLNVWGPNSEAFSGPVFSHSFWISFAWAVPPYGIKSPPPPPPHPFFFTSNESHTSLLFLLFLLVLLLHCYVEEISNRTVYWASLLSSLESALLLWKAVILLLVGSPYRQPQCIRAKRCMIVRVHKKVMGS